jgi:hypothetical protein
MRVAIVGTRFQIEDDPEVYGWVRKDVRNFVFNTAEDTQIISGGAPGPDTWGAEMARELGKPVVVIRPNWKPDGVYDPQAGFKRNSLIVEQADVVVAFWNGRSNGTRDTITKAHAANKLLSIYRYWGSKTGGLL